MNGWLLITAVLQGGGASPTDRGEYIRQIAEHWNSGRMADLRGGMLLIAGAVLLLLVLWMWRQRRRRANRSSPRATFRRIAAAAGLSALDQLFLSRIARQQRLPTPLTLLLGGGTLRHHGAQYAATLPSAQQRPAAARVERIARKLYGTAAASGD